MRMNARVGQIWVGICVVSSLVQGQTERRESLETIQGRFDHWIEKRLDHSGAFSMDAVLRAKSQIDAKSSSAHLAKLAGSWTWEWLGPGNVGGRIKDVLINPFNPDEIWIASPGGGIWKTTNRGQHWQPVDDFLPVLNVVSLAMDPLLPQNMYAGTGEYEYQGGAGQPVVEGRSIAGAGIFKSTNGGATWFQLASTNTADFHYVSRLAHLPATTNRLLAATATGLHKTTDGGTTWTKILTPDFFEAVRDVKINPANPSRILVGTVSDVYLSVDGGVTWERQTTGGRGKMSLRPGRCELAIAPTNTNVMYVSVARSSGGDELWQTDNGGTTWQQRSSNISTTVNSYTNTIWVSPTDPNDIAIGGTDYLARSTDGGTWFSILSDWRGYHNGRTTPGFSAHGDFHAIVSDPGYNGVTNRTVYVANDGGIQRVDDIATVSMYSGWTNLANNLGITQFYGGAASPDGGMIVGGTQDLYNVNYYSTKPAGGSTWGVQGWWNYIYGDGGFAAIDPTNSAHVYAESQYLAFDHSRDSGRTYQPARNGLIDAANQTRALFVAPFVMDPNNPLVLVAGGLSIWRTTDSAAHWNAIRGPQTGNPKCSAIEIYKANSVVIWAGYNNGLVSYSTNSGSTWTDVGKPWGTRFVTDIAINPTPTAYAEVIVTVGGYTNDNVWLSSDNGSTWVQRTGQPPDDLPAVHVNTVRYHPLQTNRIYVGTDLGVFASDDKGQHWIIASQSGQNLGPVNTPVEELFWQGTTHLIAATHGRGMFRTNPLLVGVNQAENIPTLFSLDQSYPNPFNPATTIRYELPARVHVLLKVFNSLGEEVATLVDEIEEPGSKSVGFNASRFPSSVYYYRLSAGEFMQTRKMLLIR